MSTPPTSSRPEPPKTPPPDASSDPADTAAEAPQQADDSGQPAMDPQVKNIQPGGGIVMSIELAWGRLRRAWLRSFFPGYVSRMQSLRQGDRGDLPFDPVDPRDVKYYRNQATYHWDQADDPFYWRESLPFVRVGLAELLILGGGMLLLAVAAGWFWWLLAIGPLIVAGLIVWFFRDPARAVPEGLGTVVAPADGKLVQIERVEDPELGVCIQFGIFLSIFNVHANRASLPGKVVAIRYRPGKFLNALRPESAKENENLDVTVELDAGEIPGPIASRRCRIRQITGQFARRIVCWVRPGDVLKRGEMFGMIKLGSRTELLIPDDPSLRVVAQLGQKIAAGNTVLAKYE
ncbi:phosphatidylserine decarboxylase [Crateriforma conspicua]|uniref:Phosphatidylserine decarboxylase n=1 Tax=Crateriforma conspicua TaxID=2527996 RepID=A0A5C5Y311_9PLAN|nr:phosphatidylserine decarboxylase [Crateriforma conspicua]TWT70136.1 phosphatidylserine decarboxylase [Crateriforma conspicua]